MSELAVLVFDGAKLSPTVTLDQILLALARHGRTRIGQYNSSNWHCTVEMHVAAAGVSFEVKSSFDHTSPISAARECAERVAAALKQK